MAQPDTHRAQAKSLLKRGLITERQHDSMMAKIEKIAAMSAPNSQGGSPPDPQMSGAVQPAAAAPVPITASVPGAKGGPDMMTA